MLLAAVRLPIVEVVARDRVARVDLIAAQIEALPDREVVRHALGPRHDLGDPGARPEEEERDPTRDQERRQVAHAPSPLRQNRSPPLIRWASGKSR